MFIVGTMDSDRAFPSWDRVSTFLTSTACTQTLDYDQVAGE